MVASRWGFRLFASASISAAFGVHQQIPMTDPGYPLESYMGLEV